MNNPWPAIIFGAALVATGVSMVVSHVRSWRREREDANLDEAAREYYRRRYRRRLQTSATLALLGVLIAVGDVLLPFQRQNPLWPTLYWVGVLMLTGWVILLGLGDFWSTASRTQAELAHIRLKQKELERQIVEFKHRFQDRDFGSSNDAG